MNKVNKIYGIVSRNFLKNGRLPAYLIFSFFIILLLKPNKILQAITKSEKQKIVLTEDVFIRDIPLVAQQKSKWCWAACLQMLYETLGFNINQCKMVAILTGKEVGECCRDQGCNEANDIPLIELGFRTLPGETNNANWDSVKNMLKRGAILLTWNRIQEDGSDGSSHAMILKGYAELGADVKLLIANNPGPVKTGDINIFDSKSTFKNELEYEGQIFSYNLLYKEPGTHKFGKARNGKYIGNEPDKLFDTPQKAADYWLEHLKKLAQNHNFDDSIDVHLDASLGEEIPVNSDVIGVIVNASRLNKTHSIIYQVYNTVNGKKSFAASIVLIPQGNKWKLRSMGHYNLGKAIESVLPNSNKKRNSSKLIVNYLNGKVFMETISFDKTTKISLFTSGSTDKSIGLEKGKVYTQQEIKKLFY